MSAGWERGATDDLRAGTAWFPVVVGGSQDQSQSHHMWEGRSSRRMGHWLALSHPYPRHGSNTVMEAPRTPNGGRHRSQEVRDKRHLENHGPAFLWPSLPVAQPVHGLDSCTRSSVPAGDRRAGGTRGSSSPWAGTGKDSSWEGWKSRDSAKGGVLVPVDLLVGVVQQRQRRGRGRKYTKSSNHR